MTTVIIIFSLIFFGLLSLGPMLHALDEQYEFDHIQSGVYESSLLNPIDSESH